MKPFFLALGVVATLIFSAQVWGEAPRRNIVLVTLDGVRWQDVFRTQAYFPYVRRLAQQGDLLFGDPSLGEEALISNTSIRSLPAYQSIFAGSVQKCFSNSCGRIQTRTFAEKLLSDSGVAQKEVATIASWEKISLAVEHQAGATFVNTGKKPLIDGLADSELSRLNIEQERDTPPWSEARWDKYTFAQGIRYLKMHRPRFLFLSFNDADEWAHEGKRERYQSTLSMYNQWIENLVETLSQMGEYGKNTTLIVTTDHGRGDGENWTEHNSAYPEAKRIWVFVKQMGAARAPRLPASTASKQPRSFSHLDIQPMVESILGAGRSR